MNCTVFKIPIHYSTTLVKGGILISVWHLLVSHVHAHTSMKKHKSVTFLCRLATLAAFFRNAFAVSIKSPCNNKAFKKKKNDILEVDKENIMCNGTRGPHWSMHSIHYLSPYCEAVCIEKQSCQNTQCSLVNRALEIKEPPSWTVPCSTVASFFTCFTGLFVQFMAICWTVYRHTKMQISWSWRVGELLTPHTQKH